MTFEYCGTELRDGVQGALLRYSDATRYAVSANGHTETSESRVDFCPKPVLEAKHSIAKAMKSPDADKLEQILTHVTELDAGPQSSTPTRGFTPGIRS